MNILGAQIKHFFCFMSNYTCINFSPVVNSVKYYVNSLVQRNIGEKRPYIE